MRQLQRFVGLAIIWLCAQFLPLPAHAQSTTDPWFLLSGGTGGTIYSIASLPGVMDPEHPGGVGAPVYFAGGDDGGTWRSLTCGATWEPVNGGPALSDGVFGGYGPELNVCAADANQCSTGLHYGGPPDMGPQRTTLVATPVTSGPSSATGISRVYRAGANGFFFSDDHGANWFTASQACMSMGQNGGYDNMSAGPELIAADRDPGHTGHVVVASIAKAGPNGERIKPVDVSGCVGTGYDECNVRELAWSNTFGAQAQASKTASAAFSPVAGKAIDSAGGATDPERGWKFSSLHHLAVHTGPENAQACVLDFAKPLCTLNVKLSCHGEKPTAAQNMELACPDIEPDNSQCACTEPTGCRYPDITGLEIDPRTGWVYAATTAGLALSVDGGRSWARSTVDKAPDERSPPLAKPNQSLPYQKGPGVRLLTGVPPSDTDPETASATVSFNDSPAWDLNLSPWRIVSVSAITMVFQPTQGHYALPSGANPATYAPRRRGTLTAMVTVTWMVKAGVQWEKRSGVFMAYAPDAGGADGSGPPVVPSELVFADVNTSERVVESGAAELHVYAETASSLSLPKLPRGAQFGATTCYDAAAPSFRCRIRPSTVAISPSDPRIAYVAMVPDTTSSDCGDPSGCVALTGLYQTLDRGNTWSLVMGANSPQTPPGSEANAATGISQVAVAPENPYDLVINTAGGVFRVAPLPAYDGAPHWPNDGQVHDQGVPCDRGQYIEPQLCSVASQCDPTAVPADVCQALNLAVAPSPAEVPFCPAASTCVSGAQNGHYRLPAFCAYHFPSNPTGTVPGATTALARPCVDCTQLSQLDDGFPICGANFHPTANGMPLRCCLGARRVDQGGAQVATAAGVTSTQQQNRGMSEDWVWAAKSFAVPGSPGSFFNRIVLGVDDNTSGVQTLNHSPGLVGTPNQWSTAAPQNLEGTAPVVLDEIQSFAPAHVGTSQARWAQWFLGSNSTPDTYATLGIVYEPADDEVQWRTVGHWFAPRNTGFLKKKFKLQLVGQTVNRVGGGAPAHFPLRAGPSRCETTAGDNHGRGRWLFGGWPGVGAMVVKLPCGPDSLPDSSVLDSLASATYPNGQLRDVSLLQDNVVPIESSGSLPSETVPELVPSGGSATGGSGTNGYQTVLTSVDSKGPCLTGLEWQDTADGAGYLWMSIGFGQKPDGNFSALCDPKYVMPGSSTPTTPGLAGC